MRLKEYRKMSDEALQKQILKLKQEQVKFFSFLRLAKMKNKKGESKGSSGQGGDMNKRIRREIARILTILNERQ